jgi:hypothetical protein
VFEFQHTAFSHFISVPLSTDARGRVALGSLPHIEQVRAKLPNAQTRTEILTDAAHTSDGPIQVHAGDAFEIPLTRTADRARTVLLENRGGTFVADRTSSVAFPDEGNVPFLRIGALPAGDYTLLLPSESRRVFIRVTDGTSALGWVLGAARYLQQTATKPTRIARLSTEAQELVVTLANVTPYTRVHIVGTRFTPSGHGLLQLARSRDQAGLEGIPARFPNLFAVGRDIGDEYRYILERRYALK